MDYPEVHIRQDLINGILLYFAKLSRLPYILCLSDKPCARNIFLVNAFALNGKASCCAVT